jgi:hypothetical protein
VEHRTVHRIVHSGIRLPVTRITPSIRHRGLGLVFRLRVQ